MSWNFLLILFFGLVHFFEQVFLGIGRLFEKLFVQRTSSVPFFVVIVSNCFKVRSTTRPPATQTLHRCGVDVDADVDDDATIDVDDDHDATTMVGCVCLFCYVYILCVNGGQVTRSLII